MPSTLRSRGRFTPRRCVLPGVGILLLGALTAGETSAQSNDTLRAVRLGSERIRLDGLLTEQIWRDAPAIGGLSQREPLEGAPATEATEVRITYDGGVMYVGVLARDREPDAVVARILARDKVMEPEFDGRPRFGGDDGIAILLDPFHDHRNAFVFATNPNGAEFDGLIADEGRSFNIDWRGVWSVAAKRIPEGWSAEFAIPFRSLRYPSTPRTWGFNVYRMIRRRNEEVLWQSWSRDNAGFARVSRAGHLDGLEDLPSPGLNADLKPYALAGGDQTRPDGVLTRRGVSDVGLDLKSEVRPGLVLDLTMNTDFAQVEVDDQQVNLTRFNLFFPEKRDFFLENSGVFDFGAKANFEPPAYQMFFSRSIGIDPDNGPVPMLGGGRLSGRVGSQTVGFLSALTDDAYGQPRTMFNVGRVKRDFGSANYVGAMVVDRRNDSTRNTSSGADFSWWPRGPLQVTGFLSRMETKGQGGDDMAWRLATDYQTNRFGLNAYHMMIGPEANAAAGFITRSNIRRSVSTLRYTVRPTALNIRRINYNLWTDHVADMDWRRLDWTTTFGLRGLLNTEDGVGLFYTRGYNRIVEAFDLAGEVRVDPGDYVYDSRSIFLNTGRARPVIGDMNADFQRTFGGRLRRISSNLTATPGMHLSLRTGYTFSRADLPNGGFVVHLVSVRAAYTFTTRVSLNTLVQYNSLARNVSANVRLNIIHRPGSDIFLVLNEERGSDLSAWDPRNRAARIKITWLARI